MEPEDTNPTDADVKIAELDALWRRLSEECIGLQRNVDRAEAGRQVVLRALVEGDNQLLLPPPSQHEGPHCGDAALKRSAFPEGGDQRFRLMRRQIWAAGAWRIVFSDIDCWLMRNRSRGAESTLSFGS